MSNLFNPKVVNHTNREGFDLSKRVLTTAAPGMLLPLYCKLCEPGDHFEINVADLTRLQPLNTAAFARIDEHFDFFFVPCNDLWKYYNDFRMQIQTGSSTQVYNGSFAYSVPQEFGPVATLGSIYDILSADNQHNANIDDFGRNSSHILTSLLGFGTDLYQKVDGGTTDLSGLNGYSDWRYTKVNIMPLLAYQKIYADFYRESRWEAPNPVAFNVDYLDDYHQFTLDGTTSAIMRLRYANYKKDYFLGLFPNVSYGGVSIEPIGITSSTTSLGVSANQQKAFGTVQAGSRNAITIESTNPPIYLQANLNMLSHRIWNILQRWREVYQMNDYRFKEQVKAMYGVDIPERRNRRSVFIDGFTNTIQIGEVVATGAGEVGSSSSVLGQIGGKGVGAVANNKTIKWSNNDEYGYIICIYHCEPRIDYKAYGVHPDLQMTDREDFYDPMFDKCDLSPVRDLALNQLRGNSFAQNDVMGYGSRYLNYKTDFDTIHLALNTSLDAWVVPYEYQDTYLSHYVSKKVSPNCLDKIMAVSYDGLDINMPLLLNCNFDVKAVRNMSANSIPY